jgi:magnesium chelatase family protein
MPEYKKHVLEVLRQPLEDRMVTISRAASTLTYPAYFMLIGAMNPCPCGYLSDPKHECRCTYRQIQRYRSRLSGPLIDRMDIQVQVPAVPYRDLADGKTSESSRSVRRRVTAARRTQAARLARTHIYCNAQMSGRHIRRYCPVNAASERLLEHAIEKLGLSARAYNRVLKIARTIADIAGDAAIRPAHVGEAIQYRSLERDRGARVAAVHGYVQA